MQLFGILVFWLLVGHALCDLSLQPEFLSRMKRRTNPEGARGRWVFGLTGHALIHSGAVALVTGSVTLGLCEFAAHWAIDGLKCEGAFGMAVDQAAHMACKLCWAVLAVGIITGGQHA